MDRHTYKNQFLKTELFTTSLQYSFIIFLQFTYSLLHPLSFHSLSFPLLIFPFHLSTFLFLSFLPFSSLSSALFFLIHHNLPLPLLLE